MSTREHVLESLRDAGAAGVSGEHLAVRLGVSRAAVAKHVAALRAEGYEVTAVPGAGYRLVSAPDLPLPSEVRRLLRDPFWAELDGGGVTASTNDDARRLAREGAPQGTVVLAARQTAGRGRLGRSWASPEGGVYLSAVLRPPIAPSEAGPLPLVIAVGVARGLDALGVDCRLKWPNDVYLDGSKIAGILLEMSAEGDRIDWVVAGVGVNVRPPAERPSGAAYVADLVAGARLAEVAAAVLDGIAGAYSLWREDGFGPLLEEYERRAYLTGSDVVVSDMTGAVRAAGRVRGVDGEGRLLVAGPDGTRTVSSGDVTLRR